MNRFLGNMLVGAASGILSAMAIGAIAHLSPLDSRPVFPPNAVIAMAGACPPGWRRYEAASGRYVVGADGRNLEAGTLGQAGGATFEYRDGELSGKGEITISASKPNAAETPSHVGSLLVSPGTPSSYIALSLCQRR